MTDKTSSSFEIESFELPALEVKIQQLYNSYMSIHGDSNYLGCLNDILGMRKEIINKRFVFTPQAVVQFERINKLLTEKSAKLIAKTALLYEQMKANKRTGDDFLDDYHLEATLDVAYRGEDSILTMETDENGGECDYSLMAEIFSMMPNSVSKPLLRFHLHDPDAVNCSFNVEELLHDVQYWENWDKEKNWEEQWLLRIPELEHIPSICNALRGLVVHSNYSLSDILRINDIRSEVRVDWRNHGRLINRFFLQPPFIDIVSFRDLNLNS